MTLVLTGSKICTGRSAWDKLGNLPPEAAREQYVATVRRAVPEWRQQDDAEEQAQRPKGGQPMGPVMSSLAHNMDAAEGTAQVCASGPLLYMACRLKAETVYTEAVRLWPCSRQGYAGE